jgi:hypothetical protein
MSGYQVVQVASTLTLPSGAASSGKAQASCPAGKVAVGGGYQVTFGQTPDVSADASYPVQGGWVVGFRNSGATNVTLTVNIHAVCVYVSQ